MEPILHIGRLYLMNCAGLMFKTRPIEVILITYVYFDREMSLKLISQQKTIEMLLSMKQHFYKHVFQMYLFSQGSNFGVFNIQIWVVHTIYHQLPLLNLYLYISNNFFSMTHLYNQPQTIIVSTTYWIYFFLFSEAWRACSEFQTSVTHRFLYSIIYLQKIFHTLFR